MNRAARRAGRRSGHVCTHGNLMKTDGNGNPVCPHGCGFKPAAPQAPKPTFREFLRQQTASIDTVVDYRGRGA